MRTPLLLFTLFAFGCSSGGQPAPASRSEARALPPPAHLPLSARALLSERMQHHGQAMSDILWSVLFLDYDAAREIAREIEREPRLSRPVMREATELNSLLPEAFFDLQDELAERASALAEAAETEDPEQVSTAFGALSRTCIRCHTAYLRDPLAR